jgi:hypothetical protein
MLSCASEKLNREAIGAALRKIITDNTSEVNVSVNRVEEYISAFALSLLASMKNFMKEVSSPNI